MHGMKNCSAVLVAFVVINPAAAQDWFGAPRQFLPADPIQLVVNVDADSDLDLIRVTPSGGAATAFTVMVNPGNAVLVLSWGARN